MYCMERFAGAQRVVLMDREPLSLVCAALSAIASGIAVEGLQGSDADANGSSGNGGSQPLARQPQPWQQQQQNCSGLQSPEPAGGGCGEAAGSPPGSDSGSQGGSGQDAGSQDGGSQNGASSPRPSLLPAWPTDSPDLRHAAGVLLQEMSRLGLSPPTPA